LTELLQDVVLTVREPLGERRFEASDLPLAIGGAGSRIVLAGRPDGVEAYLGLHEDELFVQPAEGAEVLHNGLPIRRSTWLRPGDVINFGAARLRLLPGEERVMEVDDGSTGNITAPPVITPSSRLHGDSDGEAERIDVIQFRSSGEQPERKRFAFKPARIASLVAALVVGVVLWFIFTARSISVVSDPQEADISFDGAMPVVQVAGRFLARPGAYRVRAERDGYQPAEMDIEVTDATNQSFELKLAKLPGRLRIEVPATARVTIDGKDAGVAPGEFELEPGTHNIAIAAERYQPFAADVEIEGAGQVQSLAPSLVPAWAAVSITSEPSGAQVLVDGEPRGVTPLSTEILAGNHPVELRMEGFKPWSTDIQVKANEPLTLGPIQLGLPDGRLSVRSEPAGAAVSVAGVYRGQTPLELELRPGIEHSVVVTRPGYEAVTRTVNLSAGERRTLSVPLTGVFGEVTVRAQPADAQVYVDGKNVGAANQTLRLVATTHQIEIRKQGFVDFKTSVTPRPGLPQVIETTLLTAEQTRLAQTPASIRTKAGQELKLMPLGRFTMGSPRREPGRRANEAQRNVELKRPFYMGTHEVTNAQYRQFKSEHRSGIVGPNTLDLDNQPVVGITWQDAAAYCNWLSEQEGLPPAYENKGGRLVPVNPMTRGYRLPTDAEWEWVARYDGPNKLRRYPWGDALPVAPGSGNFADITARVMVQDIVPGYDDGYAATAPVGKFPPNRLGLYDLGGNVAEWVHDYYTVTPDSSELAVDPMGPADGKQHVVRGSSWKQSSVTDLRLSARDFGDGARNDVGFRIARYVE
jgi:formylglycine-generating enzyme required for sulfatase activity